MAQICSNLNKQPPDLFLEPIPHKIHFYSQWLIPNLIPISKFDRTEPQKFLIFAIRKSGCCHANKPINVLSLKGLGDLLYGIVTENIHHILYIEQAEIASKIPRLLKEWQQ